MFINGHFFPLTLLNVSSFTSNSYFVSIYSVCIIIRSCGVVTFQMKLALTNYLSTAEETEAASEEVLDAFTDCLMKLRCMRINAFTLHNFKCMNNFIRLMFYIFF